LVDFFAGTLHSITTDQAEIVLDTFLHQNNSEQLSAYTSENHKLDSKEYGKILPHLHTCTTKSVSSPNPPDQHYSLTTLPDASGSALDFLWAAACAAAVQNPACGFGAGFGSVDWAEPFALD
jgi:hypothetical protein